MSISQIIVDAIRSVLPEGTDRVELHEPCFHGNEWIYTKECLDSGWVSSLGKFVDKFGIELASYTGSRYAIPVVNGTAALHICLNLIGISRGDEVLVPTLTFIATANAVSYCGAIPHFVDSSEDTLGIDPKKLEDYLTQIAVVKNGICVNKKTGNRIKAIVPMHTFGHPLDLDPLIQLCEKFKLAMVEDAAESLGSFYKGKHTGTFGKVSTLSFNGNKIITTGGGGAILTNDQKLADLAKHLTTTAKIPHQWSISHDMIGYNYRMPNINAALGCAQLEQIEDFLTQKRKLAESYRNVFNGINGVKFFVEPSFAKSNYWLNLLVLDRKYVGQLEFILKEIYQAGIISRPTWKPIHKLIMYQSCPKMEDLTVSEGLHQRIINIPSSVFLGR